jgi:hypothetical protein
MKDIQSPAVINMQIEIRSKNGRVIRIEVAKDTISSDDLKKLMQWNKQTENMI